MNNNDGDELGDSDLLGEMLRSMGMEGLRAFAIPIGGTGGGGPFDGFEEPRFGHTSKDDRGHQLLTLIEAEGRALSLAVSMAAAQVDGEPLNELDSLYATAALAAIRGDGADVLACVAAIFKHKTAIAGEEMAQHNHEIGYTLARELETVHTLGEMIRWGRYNNEKPATVGDIVGGDAPAPEATE